ncbi:Retrovirus-related Pol polyprotein from transposon 412, partial [Smittium mucronatum]
MGKRARECIFYLEKRLNQAPIDGSPIGAGAVLQQEDKTGARYVCRYESKAFSERERRDPSFEINTRVQSVKAQDNFIDPENDVKLKKVYDLLSNNIEINNSRLHRNEIKELKNYFLKDEILFRRPLDGRIPRRVIINKGEQNQIIQEIHSGIGGGHRGRDGTMRKIKDRYFWYSMYKDVETFIKKCDSCQRRSPIRFHEPLTPTWEPKLFGKVGVDLVLMPTGINNNKYLIIARDDLSGWVEAKALQKNSSDLVWRFLFEDIICRFGTVGKFVADRGELKSNEIIQSAKRYGVNISFTTSYHPQSNGMVERGHAPLVNALSKYCANKPGNWPKKLSLALWADRVTVKRTTGMPPYKLVYGQDAILPIENKYPSWNYILQNSNISTEELLEFRMKQLDMKNDLLSNSFNMLKHSREENKKYFDATKRIRKEPLRKGEFVLVFDNTIGKKRQYKLSDRWIGPYIVYENKGNGSYILSELDGSKIKGTFS